MVHIHGEISENSGHNTVANDTVEKNKKYNIDYVLVFDESLPEKNYDDDATVDDNTV